MANTDGRSHEIARQSIEVAHSADVNRARQLAGSMATDLGFEEKAVEEIILVVSELATNLVEARRRRNPDLDPAVGARRNRNRVFR